MSQVILHLGSNMGLRNQYLQYARQLLERRVGKVKAASAVYETGAWGIKDQRDFLNQAFRLKTKLTPDEVLTAALEIEKELGRQRKQKWGERIIDIDLIFYGKRVLNTPHLTLPHPWLQERRFVLAPLAEIIPKWKHPLLGLKVRTLLKKCPDEGWVNRVSGWQEEESKG
ncbi:MAG: 2-amino-4-hydroxy-6-hydroxymethyldihydropteridine diphosphokinase [Bacteroidota bacterium]